MDLTSEAIEWNNTDTSRTEGDDIWAQEIETSDHQSNEIKDSVYVICDNRISLGEHHHFQNVNEYTVEDLGILEVKKDMNLGCLEAFPILD